MNARERVAEGGAVELVGRHRRGLSLAPAPRDEVLGRRALGLTAQSARRLAEEAARGGRLLRIKGVLAFELFPEDIEPVEPFGT